MKRLDKRDPVRTGGDFDRILGRDLWGAGITLSARAINCLYNYGISSVDGLLKIAVADLTRWQNCGELTRREIIDAIKQVKALRRPDPWYEFAA